METRANPFFKVKVKDDTYNFEFPTILVREGDYEKLKEDIAEATKDLNKELSENKETVALSIESELKVQNETGDGGPGTEIINFLNSDTITAMCNLITLTPFITGLLSAITHNLRSRIAEVTKEEYESVNLPVESMLLEALNDLKNKKNLNVTDIVFSSNRFNENGNCFFIFRTKETEDKDLFFLYEFQDNYMQEPYVFLLRKFSCC
jgi:hypothetical protein